MNSNRTIHIRSLLMVVMLLGMFCTGPVCDAWDVIWWDDFDLFDGTYVFDNWYQRNPSGNFWHVTEKTSSFTQRMSGDCSLWYGNKNNGSYGGDVDECAALITVPANSGGTPGGDDREVVVLFWQWVETEGFYGRDWCSVYYDRNDNNWVRIFRSNSIGPGWKYQECERFVVPANSPFRIKFEFNTNGSSYNHFGGWYIDELYMISQDIGQKRDERNITLMPAKWALLKTDRPGPQDLLKTNNAVLVNSNTDNNNPEEFDQVPALSDFGILLLCLVIGSILRKKSSRTVLLIPLLFLGSIDFSDAKNLRTLKISPSDSQYDGRPSVAASANWGMAVWEKEIRNTTRLMFSYWAQDGTDWTEEYLLGTDDLVSLRHPDVARDQDNPDIFWIAFEGVDTNGKRNVYAGKADFDAWTWSYTQVNDASFDACVAPAINGDTNNKRTAFTGYLNGNSNIYTSEWTGTNWATHVRVNEISHVNSSEPSVSGSFMVYSAEDASGNREVYSKYKHPVFGWTGLFMVSGPVDAIPEIHPVVQYVPGTPMRVFVAWVKDFQGNNDPVNFRECVNYSWGPVENLTGSSAAYLDMVYESDTQSIVILAENKYFSDWRNHSMRYFRKDYRTPTPSFYVGVYPWDDVGNPVYQHRMDISLCYFRDGYNLVTWTGSPRISSENVLSDRSIVFQTLSESLYALTPAPTATPTIPTPTPTPPAQNNFNWCGIDPSMPLNTFDYTYNSTVDYGNAPDPIMFTYRSFYYAGDTAQWVVHSWDDVLSDTGCIDFERGEQIWFSFEPDSALRRGVSKPIDVSVRQYYPNGHPGTATPTPAVSPTPKPTGTSTPTPRPVPNPSLSPYITIAPWKYSPSRKGVLRFTASIPPNCSGPPGDIMIRTEELSVYTTIAQTTDWVWNAAENNWEFLWDGLYDDGQGKWVCPSVGHCYLQVNPGSNWYFFDIYRTSITIE